MHDLLRDLWILFELALLLYLVYEFGKLRQVVNTIDQATDRLLVAEWQGVIITVDTNDMIVRVSADVRHLLGYTDIELIEKPLTTIIPERFRERHLAAFAQYLITGKKTMNWTHVEWIALHKDGTEVPVLASYTQHNGGPAGLRYFTAMLRPRGESHGTD